MNAYTRNLVWPVMLFLAGLAGCASTPQARLYVIEPLINATAPDARPNRVVVVGPITLPERLDRREILTHKEFFRVAAAEFDRWAEPLDENISRAIIANLSALNQSASFLPYPPGRLGPDDFSVLIIIHEFGNTPSGRVVLNASWALRSAQDQVSQYVNTRLLESPEDSSIVSMVAAMSRLVARLSREIAAALDEEPADV